MIKRFAVRLSLALLALNVVCCIGWADVTGSLPAVEPAAKTTNAFHPLSPGPADGQIALATAYLLQRFHYLRQKFDATVSGKFFDHYFEAYDPQHLHFLQSDLAEFEHYRTNLDRLTLADRRPDTRPATEIFNRFVQRLQQRVEYVDQLLKEETFAFDTDERIAVNRKDLPYPKDLDEAKQLWRERLRFEYLTEKLGKIEAKKQAAALKTEPRLEPYDHEATNGIPNLGTPPGSDTHSEAATGLTATNQPAEQPAEVKPKKTEAEEIVETLSHRYHRTLRTVSDWDSDDILQTYLTALAHVYDPHSDYFGKSQADSFAIGMNLSLFGIGAELLSQDGYCTINRLLAGGPAMKSQQIHEKDRIIAVAQSNQPPVDVVDMSLNKAVQLIRGPKGTEVRLTLIPFADSSARKVVSLIRDEIPLEEQAAKARIIEIPAEGAGSLRLGIIDLPSFYAPFDPSNARTKTEHHYSSTDVSRLLTKFTQEKVAGVILDLRRNGGGSLEEAIKLAGLFIKEGPIVQVRAFDDSVQEDDDADPSVLYDGPLVVLTSRFSASASEIVAAALQDYGRALVVGDSSTHGKGTVQTVQPLKDVLPARTYPWTNDPGQLKLTIKKFYRVSGVSTQLKGVVPDIILPSVLNESKDIGEAALDNPLACDKITSAKYERLNRVEPYLPELRRRSGERIATDKEFSYIREDISLFKKQQADKTVSLNEQERLKEKAEADARDKARDQERLARKDSGEKVFELTLKQALLPGLPSPTVRTNVPTARLASSNGLSPARPTNELVSAPQPPASPAHLETAVKEEKPPPQDPALTECEHILVDYLSVLAKGNPTNSQPSEPLAKAESDSARGGAVSSENRAGVPR